MDPTYVKEVADTIWEQIPLRDKAAIAACRSQALTMQVGEWVHPGIGFHINPAVGSFIPLDVDIENAPRFKMLVLLDEGRDTYICQRYRIRDDQDNRLPEPVMDWSENDIYCDQLGEVLFQMTDRDPPQPDSSTTVD